LIVVRDRIEEYAYLANAGIMILLVSSLIYFGYLTYLEANVIHAWCQWCVATSIVAVILFLVEAFRLRDDFRDPDDVPEYAYPRDARTLVHEEKAHPGFRDAPSSYRAGRANDTLLLLV